MAKAYPTKEANVYENATWEDFPFSASTEDLISDRTDVDWLSPEFDEACDMFAAEFPGEPVKTVKWVNRAAKRVSVNGVNYTLYTKEKECC